ncbi:MAG: DeoR/GlpR family DNA-binding transcription regulator [Burkholderiaceae bacterium]|nr:DeoR/GlpR family DNA-binding transcription regulator [Burkholderiaceae bacterium]
MVINPRQQQLIDLVRDRSSMRVEDLARLLDVTPQTVRRDVGALAEAGLLARFHGGVALPASTVQNIAYQQRQELNTDGKRRIAEAVAREVPDGCSMILNIGTTTEEVARSLRHRRDLRVVTNNLNVAAILAENETCEVIVAGGIVRPRDRGIVGEAAVDFIRQFRVDIGVIGISSIEPDGTLRDFDYREVKVAQTIIEQSREVWLVADASKFGRRAMVQLAHLSQVDVLFTDESPPPPLLRTLADSGGRCVVAD